MKQLAREAVSFWTKGFAAEAAKKLENFGFIQLRPGGTVLLHSPYSLIPSIAVEGVSETYHANVVEHFR